jgi:hypothetical protein
MSLQKIIWLAQNKTGDLMTASFILHDYFKTFITFRPAAPLTPPPPWTPLPQRYKLSMGVL